MPEDDCGDAAAIALPPGWRLALKLRRGDDGFHGGTAELFEGDAARCRMQLSHLDRDRQVALARVATRIGLWLVEWQSRDHSGNTGFADL